MNNSIVRVSDNLGRALGPISAYYEILIASNPDLVLETHEDENVISFTVKSVSQEQSNASPEKTNNNDSIQESSFSDAGSDYPEYYSSEKAGPFKTT
jgi:hypothetical protein